MFLFSFSPLTFIAPRSLPHSLKMVDLSHSKLNHLMAYAGISSRTPGEESRRSEEEGRTTDLGCVEASGGRAQSLLKGQDGLVWGGVWFGLESDSDSELDVKNGLDWTIFVDQDPGPGAQQYFFHFGFLLMIRFF